MRGLLQTVLLISTLTACQTYLEPEDAVPTATGTWSGLGAAGFTIFELTLSITEGEFGRITGTGRLTSPGRQTFDFVVRNGAHGHPDLLLSLATANFVDVNFSGRFLEIDRIAGMINGSGFNNALVTINRAQVQ
jgi:hypothetical protein